MKTLTRNLISLLIVVGALFGAACAPAATPTATVPPAKSTAVPAAKATEANAPKAPATQAAKPTAPAAKVAAKADWQADWDQTVAAAKKEGKVVVAGAPGDLYRKAAMAFHSAYPDIDIEFTGFRGSDFAPRVLGERDAGQYLWDVHQGGWNTPLISLKPKGVLAPLRPLLVLPEVLDDSKWLTGFEDGWVDNDRQLEYQFESRLFFFGFVNRDVVPESELSAVDQLLQPQWKGRISSQDPRLSGPFSVFVGYLIGLKGEAWVRQLLGQDLRILTGGREQMEALARGALPVGLGINSGDLEQFKKEGAAGSIRALAPESAEGRRLTSGFGNLLFIDRAPHPNAAKVYINWLLTREGQKAYAEATEGNSRRLDVEGPPDTAPDPKAKYDVNEREWSPLFTTSSRAMEIGKELFK